MKSFIFLLLSFFVFTIKSQMFYACSKYSQTFNYLTGATSINNGTAWAPSQSFSVPIGFNFFYFNNTYTVIHIEGSGFTYFDAANKYNFLPFRVQLKDAGSGLNSLSPLSYKLMGSSPNRTLTIEWKNCQYVNDTVSFANFQISLTENFHHIRIHYGPCTPVNPSNAFSGHNPAGPVIGVFIDNPPSEFYSVLMKNSPPSESCITSTNNLVNLYNHSMNGVPPPGTVYDFYIYINSLNDYDQQNKLINFHPNPAYDKIYFPEEISILQYEISDLSGKRILHGLVHNNEISIHELREGVYNLKLLHENGKFYHKKLIKH